MSPEEFVHFRQFVEVQSPRLLRRYLDYGKRLKSGRGMGELRQWLGRILLDDGQVYSLEERARAFEIAACERLAGAWLPMCAALPEPVLVGGPVDKLMLYRLMFAEDVGAPRRAALFELLGARYKKSWEWVRSCAAHRGEAGPPAEGSMSLFDEFLDRLERLEPLAAVGGMELYHLQREVERLQTEARKEQKASDELRQNLDFAEERAQRTHLRLKEVEAGAGRLSRRLRQERENGDKLRCERRRRIRLERQSSAAARELEELRREYLKLDQRLRQMAGRLAESERRRLAAFPPSEGPELSSLRSWGFEQLLGLGDRPSAEEVDQMRRRFAAIFHSDRVNQLPAWVRDVCDEILSIVNETCDRARKGGRQ